MHGLGRSRALDRKIDPVHIQPGKPTQNAYVESFNSKLREGHKDLSSTGQDRFNVRILMGAQGSIDRKVYQVRVLDSACLEGLAPLIGVEGQRDPGPSKKLSSLVFSIHGEVV